jgi:hypothetical protein
MNRLGRNESGGAGDAKELLLSPAAVCLSGCLLSVVGSQVVGGDGCGATRPQPTDVSLMGDSARAAHPRNQAIRSI